jgi:hypothetical protein
MSFKFFSVHPALLRQITGEPKGLLMKAALTASLVHPLLDG